MSAEQRAASLHGAIVATERAVDELARAALEPLHARLFRFGRFWLSREDAADAAADAVERIWRMRDRYQTGGAPFEAWALTIGVNVIRDVMRRRRRRPPTSGLEDVEAFDAPGTMVSREDLLDVRAGLGRLSADDAEVIAARYALDLPVAEIARIQGRSPGAVSTALHRAMARLREELTHG
jgi:RNA polymerase sigma-70 factor (ECF subfamily)